MDPDNAVFEPEKTFDRTLKRSAPVQRPSPPRGSAVSVFFMYVPDVQQIAEQPFDLPAPAHIFSFFQNKLDGMTVLAFGTILAVQFGKNVFDEQIHKISSSLDELNDSMEVINHCCEVEAT